MTSLQLVTWKNNSLKSVFVLITLLSLQARADVETFFKETLGATGSIRAAAWDRDKSYTDARGYGVGSAWLTLRPQEVAGFKMYADGFVQGQDLAREEFSRADLRELYVEKSLGNFDFKVGRSIIIWGRADKVNPTDSLSVRNYKLLMTDDEDQRTGVFSTQVAYNLGNTRLIALWLPEWRSPVYPIPPLAGLILKDDRPDQHTDQYAFKIDQSGGSVDWSLSYFHGFNKLPDLVPAGTTPSGAIINFNYGKVDVIGADFATTYGEYGFRGETALTLTRDSSGNDSLVQNSTIYTVLGVERSFIENFNINVQVLHKHVLDYVNPDSITDQSVRMIAQQVALNSNQPVEDQFGFSLRPSYKMYNDTLEMETALVLWAHNTNSLIRPKVTYAFTDAFKGILGMEYYSGPQNSLFGRLQKTSSGFLELRYNF